MRAVSAGLALALLLAAPARQAPAGGLECARALSARLHAAGRAEATVELLQPTLSGNWRSVRGRLALEPPDRARLDFPATGEQVTLRADGGEWLQPVNRQLLRLGPERAAPALSWWQVFLAPDSGGFREERRGAREFVVRRVAGAGADDEYAVVRLGADGLPVTVEPHAAGDAPAPVCHLRGWRFPSARGRAAFRLAAPPGFAEVELP